MKLSRKKDAFRNRKTEMKHSGHQFLTTPVESFTHSTIKNSKNVFEWDSRQESDVIAPGSVGVL